jgi:uncharacterized protein involved in outer membrane biogenesis
VALSSVAVVAVLSVNFLVGRNKDYLIRRMEQALERKVSMDKIELTRWPIGARFVNFALGGDPLFADAELLRARDVRMEFRVLPLLLGRLRLKRIVLTSPVVPIVRDATGRYNFASPAGTGKNERNSAVGGKKASAENRYGQLLLIASLAVSDGTLHYRDLNNYGGLTATRINLKVNDFRWDEPFDIYLDAAVMAPKQNLQFRTRLGPVAGNRDYRDVPFDGQLDADALDLGRINAALPQFRKTLPRALRFDGVYTITGLRFKGTWNNLSLKGAVTGSDASFRFE